ncbi:rhodanese-like domain-containing protein [Rhodovibrionaceae bacterium A322]
MPDEAVVQLGYAGDLTSQQAHTLLFAEPSAVLVDTRTLAEWQFVGVPDLSQSAKEVVFLDWQVYPDMRIRNDFAERLLAKGIEKDRKVLLICRSGVRSRAAALALTKAGYSAAYNVSDGFEGPLDAAGHRGRDKGWKASGLPWIQQ